MTLVQAGAHRREISLMDDNKRNLQYFEAESMAELFDALQTWQHEKEKRFLSLDIQNDHGKFCCIALTNPSEVVIVGSDVGTFGKLYQVKVNAGGALKTGH
jgi:hypothetical protein